MPIRRRRAVTAYSHLSEIERKFIKMYSAEELVVIKQQDDSSLEGIISTCSANIVRSKAELEANPEYQRAMEILTPLRKGYNDAVKWQDTKRKIALQILHQRGRVDIGIPEDDLDQ